MFYFGARYYDPSIGRWISKDPMDQFFSEYSYCGNDPLHMVDPWGLEDFGVAQPVNIQGNIEWGHIMDNATPDINFSNWAGSSYISVTNYAIDLTYEHMVSSEQLTNYKGYKDSRTNSFISNLSGDWTNKIGTHEWYYEIPKVSLSTKMKHFATTVDRVYEKGGTVGVSLTATAALVYGGTGSTGMLFMFPGNKSLDISYLWHFTGGGGAYIGQTVAFGVNFLATPINTQSGLNGHNMTMGLGGNLFGGGADYGIGISLDGSGITHNINIGGRTDFPVYAYTFYTYTKTYLLWK